MALKNSTSLAIMALAGSIWIGCSSQEDKEKYDHYYGSGSKAREETALVKLQDEKNNPVPVQAPAPAASTPAASASGTDTASTAATPTSATAPAPAADAAPVAAVEVKPKRKAVPADVSALLNKHACFACHQAYDKVIGPAYSNVAKKKYTSDEIVALVHAPKPEHWPGYPPMAPMPHVPKADIVVIANWINSL